MAGAHSLLSAAKPPYYPAKIYNDRSAAKTNNDHCTKISKMDHLSVVSVCWKVLHVMKLYRIFAAFVITNIGDRCVYDASDIVEKNERIIRNDNKAHEFPRCLVKEKGKSKNDLP